MIALKYKHFAKKALTKGKNMKVKSQNFFYSELEVNVLKTSTMSTQKQTKRNKDELKTEQEIKDYEQQFQVVKFIHGNAYIESFSKMKYRDFYFAEQMIQIKQSGKNDDIATRVWDASIVLAH